MGIRSHAKGTFHEYVPKGRELETKEMNKVAKDKLILNITFAWEHAVAITDEKDEGALVSHRFPQFTLHPEIIPNFLKYVILDESFRHHLYLASPGGAGRNRVLKISQMLEYAIKYPSTAEQLRISNLLDSINSLITLHQRKWVEFFYPTYFRKFSFLNFWEFFNNRITNAWEQRKFSKLYKRSSEKNDGSIGIERNITVATMQFKSDIRLSSDDYLKTYFTFKVGDIAFEGHQSKEFRYGRFVENDIGDGVVSHIFTVFRPIQRFDLHFWKYAISSENLMQKILSRSTKASTMMHDLVPEDFLNETFLVPSIDEQKAVGKFLHQIDNLLTLHQRQSVSSDLLGASLHL